jgi:hypothetical protein
MGIRAHSGWGAAAAVSFNVGSIDVIDRRRVGIVDPETPGAAQPYHFAEKLALPEAEKHLARCAAVSNRLALAAVSQMVQELRARGYRISGAAIVLASGRPLPALPQILASHALIHAAEGEFFRQAFRSAFERLEIQVTGIPERQLEARAKNVFATGARQVQQRIANAGRQLGPPWTTDQKTAALAAALVLKTLKA